MDFVSFGLKVIAYASDLVGDMLPRTAVIETGFEAGNGRSGGALFSNGAMAEQAPRLPAWMGVRGFVDIHCHVTPGLDDGPAGLAEAVDLARIAYRWGTLAMVATPHRSLRYTWSRQALTQGLRRLDDRLPEGPVVFAGCELELSDESWRGFEENPRSHCLNGSRYVLVEFPRNGSARCFAKLLERLRAKGLAPIVAHAERCRLLTHRAGEVVEWVAQGCLLQLTADAVCGRRGRAARAASAELLRAGLVHFVASDAHDAFRRGPNLQPAFREVTELLGVEQAAKLFTHNPLRVLQDRPLGDPVSSP